MFPNQRTSYGIALCRNNPEKNNILEILLIKKRYTYHFYSFVMGHYKKGDLKYIKHLLDNMTCAEKIDILGMQFAHMWQRIWLNNPKEHFNINDSFVIKDEHKKFSNAEIYRIFFQKKAKFERNFTTDNGKLLKSLIQNGKAAEIIWEIPKGSSNDGEKELDTAMREFYEETSIEDHYYKILYNIPPVVHVITDNEITYTSFYYIAVLKKPIVPTINFRNYEQISEIEQIRWISIEEIRFMNLSKIYHQKLVELFRLIGKKYKKYKSL